MAITASFDSATGTLSVVGDSEGNNIVISRDAAGSILVNGGAVNVTGGTPTVANTAQMQVFAEGGNDTVTLDEINGALPRANLFGGAGDDTLTGGSGDDQLFGESGNDNLFGRGGFDFLFGGTENDALTGGDADDQVFGESGDDRLIWNPGDDTDLFEGGAGIDTAEVNGGGGAEIFTATANGTRVRFDRLDPAPFALDLGAMENLAVNANGGNDSFSATGNLAALIKITVDGSAGEDTVLGSNGVDLLLGGDNSDFVDGQQGNDVAFLGGGDDTFQWDPGDGSDIIEGQDGTDTLLFNGSGGAEIFSVQANGGRGLLTRNLGNIVMDFDDLETVDIKALGSADAITIGDLSGTDIAEVNIDLAGVLGGTAGDAQADAITLNATNDADASLRVAASGGIITVTGLPAEVTIAAAEFANDTVTVNALGGSDIVDASDLGANDIILVINGGNGSDVITGGAGADALNGGAGDDMLEGGAGADAINGEADDDTASYAGSNSAVTVSLLANTAADGHAQGDALSDIQNLTGSAFADTLTGDGAANYFDRRRWSGPPEGRQRGRHRVLQRIERGGRCEPRHQKGSGGHAQGDILTSIENLTGSAHADTLVGNTLANRLSGGLGSDNMRGGAGDDRYVVDNAADAVSENSGEGLDTVEALLNHTLGLNL